MRMALRRPSPGAERYRPGMLNWLKSLLTSRRSTGDEKRFRPARRGDSVATQYFYKHDSETDTFRRRCADAVAGAESHKDRD